MRWNATRLPSGDQFGLDALSDARTRWPDPSALTMTMSLVSNGADRVDRRAPCRRGTTAAVTTAHRGCLRAAGPIRRAWRPPAARASRSDVGHVEAGAPPASLPSESDLPAVGRERREHAVHPEPESRRAAAQTRPPGTTNRWCAGARLRGRWRRTGSCAHPVTRRGSDRARSSPCRPAGASQDLAVTATGVRSPRSVVAVVPVAEGDATAIGRPGRRTLDARTAGHGAGHLAAELAKAGAIGLARCRCRPSPCCPRAMRTRARPSPPCGIAG